MKKIKLILPIVSFFLLLGLSTFAEEVNKTFDAKNSLKVVTVSGDCTIEKSTNNKIEVHLTYTFTDDCFEYIINETADRLEIREKFNSRGRCNGMSEWSIRVPENMEVRFSSASGDFNLNGTKNGVKASTASGNVKVKFTEGSVDINTASGEVEVMDAKGELDLNTASGDVEIENIEGKTNINTASGSVHVGNATQGLDVGTASGRITAHNLSDKIYLHSASGRITVENAKGILKLKTASGDIEASTIEITDESYFKSASGDVEVMLSKTSDYDLTLASASGNSILDYNGNEIKGFFEFTARVDRGDIISPIAFDKEDVIEKYGKDYDVKSFTKGNSTPKIIIKTSSGKAKLIK